MRQVEAGADAVVDRLLRRLAEVLVSGSANVGPSSFEHGPLNDDTLIDQTNSRVPRELYLRLARQAAFRSFKDGKRVFAFWGEVRVALDARMAPKSTTTTPVPDPDDLDAAREQLGLAAKTRRLG